MPVLFLALAVQARAQEPSQQSHVAASPSHSEGAAHVPHDAVKAAGGGKRLSSLRTVTLEGSVAAAGGVAGGSFTLDVKLPNRYYMELVAGDRSVIEAYNGKSAWRQNAAGVIGTLVGPEGLQIEAAARYYNSHLVNFKRNRLIVTFIGPAQVRGKDAIELEVTSLAGPKRQVYFDAQTHLVVQEAATMGGVDQKIFYDDYKPVDGVQLPHKIELQRGIDSFQIQITRAAVNESIGERVFDFPRKSQVVLPDLKALFAEVRAKEAANEKLRQKYAGTKIDSETDVDKKGNSTKTVVTESSFFYLNGSEVDRLLKKEGQPLSAADQKAEDDRVAKEVARLKAEAANKKPEEPKPTASKDQSAPADSN